jgi:hypothetical protein
MRVYTRIILERLIPDCGSEITEGLKNQKQTSEIFIRKLLDMRGQQIVASPERLQRV